MIRKFIFLTIFFLPILGLLAERNTFAEELNTLQLSYKILESYSSGEDITLLVKLRAKNPSSNPLYNAKAVVSSTANMAINTNKVYFGNINAGETLESSESFNISFKRSLSQEPPQKEITWQVEYTDVNGNLIFEEVSLK